MEKNINYTDMAVQKLDNAIAKLRKDIEKDIVKSKNYPGEDVIEITASDIEDAFERIIITSPKSNYSNKRRTYLNFFALLYVILGFILIIYAIYSREIRSIIEQSDVSFMYLVLGVTTISMGTLVLLMGIIKSSEQALRQKKIDEFREKEELHNYISYIEWKMREQSENQSLEVNCEANEKKTPSNPDSEPKIEGI